MVYHTHDSRKSRVGFPDLTLVRGSRLIFAELKGDTEYGRRGPTLGQRQWLAALEAVPNVEVHLWRPQDFDRVVELLAR